MLSASEWRKALGFVPTAAAQAAATPKKVNFLSLVRNVNPSVSNSAMQRFLTDEISPICFELKPHILRFLAKELGDSFLTLCGKTVRESTRTFAVYSLNQISEEVLSGVSLKGKKPRYRDWRDVVFTMVLQTPVVEYHRPAFPVPSGYMVVPNNHELLRAAEKFGNCVFRLSGERNIVNGVEFIALHEGHDDRGPIMLHFGHFVDTDESEYDYIIEVQHKENKSVTMLTANIVTFDFFKYVKYSLPEYGWDEAECLPYEYVQGGGMIVVENLRTPEGWFRKAQDLPYQYIEGGLLVTENVPEAGWYKPCRLRQWHNNRIPAFLEGREFWD